MAVVPLSKVLAALKKRYGKPKPHPAGRDPLGILVWEMVAYLGGASVRDDVFRQLRTQIGLDPQDLLDTPLDTLTGLCRAGGPVAPLHRAKCIQICAALAEASALLRLHGKETCKTSTPRCEECPVTSACAWYRAHNR